MNFFILWTALGHYEWVENWPDSPHEYAWSHKYYGKSNYIIIPAKEYPLEFEQTPEDKLLVSIFTKNK